jgi:ketosteroid isomerase-like protein
VARYLALICLLALLAGCGGDDKKDAEQTVSDFVTALRERDADTVCDDLVTKEFLGQFSGATGDKAKESCKRELKSLTGLEKVRLVKVEGVKVSGDEATVTAVIERQGQRQRQVYRLKKEDGDWKLSGAG